MARNASKLPDLFEAAAPEEVPAEVEVAGRVGVLLPLPLKGIYDYAVPVGLDLAPGDPVAVPFGPREMHGIVWGPGQGDVADAKLKPVIARLDAPALGKPLRDFVDWVARYTVSAPGSVLRMMLSIPEALEAPKPLAGFVRATDADKKAADIRMTPARKKVLEAAADGAARTGPDLARAAGVSTSVVHGLAGAGVLTPVEILPQHAPPKPDAERPGPELSADQAAAAGELVAAVGQGFSVHLLDGVTGSGKTEVYFEAAAAALRAGRQVLVLLPEIALSAQWLNRFQERFGVLPAEWHSDLTRAQRRETWRAVAAGEVRVLVGARSALYLPFPELGLIVVDEEHEAAYKQEDGVIYHARDMAVVRGQLTEIPIVLATATPSLETHINAGAGRYGRQVLTARHGGAAMPEVEVVDMRTDGPPSQRWLSARLTDAVTTALEANEQAMLFLNRRGYAPLTLCRTCGYRFQCPDCTAWLVEHRLLGRLQCHHCGYGARLPDECPECGKEETFAACGPGVERLAEEVIAAFPEARVAIMSSDTVHGPAAASEMVRQVQEREIDLLIGTQLMAKGYHFPMLTLVGVVDADLGLAGGDLRAAERTYQLLTQVAGRAGRAERPGRVLLQSYMPDHPVLKAMLAGDRDRFLAAEAEDRETRGMPPAGRLAALIVSGRDQNQVAETANMLRRRAPEQAGIEVLGPAPAPLAVLRGMHRYRLLLKTRRDINIQGVVRGWLNGAQWPSAVKVKVDIDPYSFL